MFLRFFGTRFERLDRSDDVRASTCCLFRIDLSIVLKDKFEVSCLSDDKELSQDAELLSFRSDFICSLSTTNKVSSV